MSCWQLGSLDDKWEEGNNSILPIVSFFSQECNSIVHDGHKILHGGRGSSSLEVSQSFFSYFPINQLKILIRNSGCSAKTHK